MHTPDHSHSQTANEIPDPAGLRRQLRSPTRSVRLASTGSRATWVGCSSAHALLLALVTLASSPPAHAEGLTSETIAAAFDCATGEGGDHEGWGSSENILFDCSGDRQPAYAGTSDLEGPGPPYWKTTFYSLSYTSRYADLEAAGGLNSSYMKGILCGTLYHELFHVEGQGGGTNARNADHLAIDYQTVGFQCDQIEEYAAAAGDANLSEEERQAAQDCLEGACAYVHKVQGKWNDEYGSDLANTIIAHPPPGGTYPAQLPPTGPYDPDNPVMEECEGCQ